MDNRTKELGWFEERIARERELLGTFDYIYKRYKKQMSELHAQDLTEEETLFEGARIREEFDRAIIEWTKSYQMEDYLKFLKTA